MVLFVVALAPYIRHRAKRLKGVTEEYGLELVFIIRGTSEINYGAFRFSVSSFLQFQVFISDSDDIFSISGFWHSSGTRGGINRDGRALLRF